jgi:NADH-quinone oxidoreductase subunit J
MESVGSPNVVQIVLGFLTLVTALSVVLSKNPVVSAVNLMATLFLTGALYIGLGHFFMGAIQILIYAGAIAVLFVFIVMLLDLKPLSLTLPGRAVSIAGGVFVSLFLGLGLSVAAFRSSFGNQGAAEVESLASIASPSVISLQFLSKYHLPFQVAGLLIFATVMGVVVLGKPKKQLDQVEGK